MWVRRFLWRFGKETKGIASLEFVIVLFPMLLILFAMIQFGGMFYYFSEMQIAARDAARRMAEDDILNPGVGDGNPVACSSTVVDSIEEYACSFMTIPGTPDITAEFCQEAAPIPVPGNPDIPGVYDAIVTVTSQMADISLVDLLGVAGGRTVTANVVMRVHPRKAKDVLDIGPAIAGC